MWCHLHIWGYWYFSWQSWFQLVLIPTQDISWYTLHLLFHASWPAYRFLKRLRLKSLRSKIFRMWGASVIRRPLHFCEFYLQVLYQVLPVNIGEKFLHASSRRKGKETILKYSREFWSTSCLQVNILYQSLTFLEEEKYPMPVLSRHSVMPKKWVGIQTGKYEWSSQSKRTGSPNVNHQLRTNSRTSECFPSSNTLPLHTKSLFTTVSSTHYIMSPL